MVALDSFVFCWALIWFIHVQNVVLLCDSTRNVLRRFLTAVLAVSYENFARVKVLSTNYGSRMMMFTKIIISIRPVRAL